MTTPTTYTVTMKPRTSPIRIVSAVKTVTVRAMSKTAAKRIARDVYPATYIITSVAVAA